MDDSLYHYNASLLRIVDGDTFDAMIDMGFSCFCKQRIRILGIQCPEIHTKDAEAKAGGIAASYYAHEIMDSASQLVIRTVSKDSFGRWLADVWSDGKSVGDRMLAAGHATVYVAKR